MISLLALGSSPWWERSCRSPRRHRSDPWNPRTVRRNGPALSPDLRSPAIETPGPGRRRPLAAMRPGWKQVSHGMGRSGGSLGMDKRRSVRLSSGPGQTTPLLQQAVEIRPSRPVLAAAGQNRDGAHRSLSPDQEHGHWHHHPIPQEQPSSARAARRLAG